MNIGIIEIFPVSGLIKILKLWFSMQAISTQLWFKEDTFESHLLQYMLVPQRAVEWLGIPVGWVRWYGFTLLLLGQFSFWEQPSIPLMQKKKKFEVWTSRSLDCIIYNCKQRWLCLHFLFFSCMRGLVLGFINKHAILEKIEFWQFLIMCGLVW
jgi:hypothetical protein